jgi:hypothetical protein
LEARRVALVFGCDRRIRKIKLRRRRFHDIVEHASQERIVFLAFGYETKPDLVRRGKWIGKLNVGALFDPICLDLQEHVVVSETKFGPALTVRQNKRHIVDEHGIKCVVGNAILRHSAFITLECRQSNICDDSRDSFAQDSFHVLTLTLKGLSSGDMRVDILVECTCLEI